MKIFWKKILTAAAFLLLASGCSRQITTQTPKQTQTSAPLPITGYVHQFQIGGQILNVEIADTRDSEQQGLSDRMSMDQDQGMLFDFGQSASLNQPFWMKDMDFNLDFIWLYQNKIVGITQDAAAPAQGAVVSSLPLYYPPSPINQVLEVNAGWAEKNNIKVGDQTKILN